MPFDPILATRLREILKDDSDFELKRMFGGVCWMLNKKMCVGVHKEWLIVRVGETTALKLFKEKHVKPMDITGKPMKGWAMVASKGLESDEKLRDYVKHAKKFVSSLPDKD